MGLRMKNYVLGVHWKIRVLGGGSSRKTDNKGGFKGELARKRGVVFFRVGGLIKSKTWETSLLEAFFEKSL